MTPPPVVRLDSVAEVRLGRQRSPKDHVGPQMRAYVRAANVGWDGLLLDDVKTMNFTDDEMKVYGLQPGDLLLNEASGSAPEVGKPAIWTGEIDGCAFQNTLLRVRPKDADPRYLLHYFKQQAVTGAFARQARGVGIHHLGREALAAWPIPLPAIDDQRRIAAMLDQVEIAREKRKTALVTLDSLIHGVFHEIFGPATDLSLVPLEQAFSDKPIFGSMVVPGISGSWLALRVGNIQKDRLDLRDRKYVELAERDVRRHAVRDGDLLMARAIASQDHLGKCVVVYPGQERWAFDSHLMRIRLDPTRLLPEFLKQWLATRLGRASFLKVARRSSVQFNVNTKEISRLAVPMPPIERQHQFVEALRAIEHRRTIGELHAGGLDELTASLQHRAFASAL